MNTFSLYAYVFKMYDKDINLKDPKGNLDNSYSNLGVHKSQV